MSSFRPSASLAALVVRRATAAPMRHPASPASLYQRRFLPSSSSSSSAHAGPSASGSSSSSSTGSREPPRTNKHKQWYRELVPAALPAIAIGLGVYMVRGLLGLSSVSPAPLRPLVLTSCVLSFLSPVLSSRVPARPDPTRPDVASTARQALHLLRLTLSSERELLALNAQVATLEAELADLQDRHGRSVSSTLREMFSKAAGGQTVVDALANDDSAAAAGRAADNDVPPPEAKPAGRKWWGWGRA